MKRRGSDALALTAFATFLLLAFALRRRRSICRCLMFGLHRPTCNTIVVVLISVFPSTHETRVHKGRAKSCTFLRSRTSAYFEYLCWRLLECFLHNTEVVPFCRRCCVMCSEQITIPYDETRILKSPFFQRCNVSACLPTAGSKIPMPGW